jgi:hypothetical protein
LQAHKLKKQKKERKKEKDVMVGKFQNVFRRECTDGGMGTTPQICEGGDQAWVGW